MAKKILFVFRHAPYGTALAREGLEALLAAAVYEQDVAALFLNDGVFQLLEHQDTGSNVKNHGRMLSALPVYGVDKVYVHEPSLAVRGFDCGALAIDAQALSNSKTRDLMSRFDQILSF